MSATLTRHIHGAYKGHICRPSQFQEQVLRATAEKTFGDEACALSTYIVECRVSIIGIISLFWEGIHHNSTPIDPLKPEGTLKHF